MSRMSQEQVIRTLRKFLPPLALLGAVVLVLWALTPATPPTPTDSPVPVRPSYPGVSLVRTITTPRFEPWGIAAADGGRLLVTDRATNDLLVFDGDGALVASARRRANGVELLDEPTGVCRDAARRRIYVADSGHHRIAVFDDDLSMTGSFGGPGTAPGQFDRPVGIAVDGRGRVFVAQVDSARLQVFDGDGTVLQVKTADELGMDFLWDVACLPGGGVALSSALGGLTLYDEALHPTASVADRGRGRGLYLFTTGVAVDESGRLLVCAKTQGKVMLFEPPTADAPRGTLLAEVQSTDGPEYAAAPPPMLASLGTTAARTQIREHLQHTLQYPMDVTFLPGRRFAVAERGNGRVLVFEER